jgi:hypothetical protein
MGVLVVGLLKGGSYMRREELWKAITNVHHAIVNTKIQTAFDFGLRGDDKTAAAEKIVKPFQEWSIFARTTGPAERQV